MASKKGNRIQIKMRSTEGTGTFYMTWKNRINSRERLELKKYDPKLRRHVMFKEER